MSNTVIVYIVGTREVVTGMLHEGGGIICPNNGQNGRKCQIPVNTSAQTLHNSLFATMMITLSV